MAIIYVDAQDHTKTIEISNFLDAEKIQRLFVAFRNPEKTIDNVYNLRVLAEHMGDSDLRNFLNNQLEALELIERTNVPDVSREVYRACCIVKNAMMGEVKNQMGNSLELYIDLFVGRIAGAAK